MMIVNAKAKNELMRSLMIVRWRTAGKKRQAEVVESLVGI
jgi:hypothetical protein